MGLIDYITEHSNIDEYYSFCRMIAKFLKFQGDRNFKKVNVLSEFEKMVNIDDKKFFQSVIKKENKNYDERYSFVSLNYGNYIRPFFKSGKYLDIGCGTGKKTEIVGRNLGLNKCDIYGCDINSWSNFSGERNNENINYSRIKDKLPYENEQFTLVSFFMVLHHVKYLDFIINEAKRVLKKGGILVIREHDCISKVYGKIIDCEHYLYSYLNDLKHDHTKNKIYGSYRSMQDWNSYLKSKGFKLLILNYDYYEGKPEISATRTFRGIFQKEIN